MSEWETFCDICYYDLWRVRRKDNLGFNDGFHLQHEKEAKELVELLNKLENNKAIADGSLIALERAIKYIPESSRISFEDALWRLRKKFEEENK